MKKKKILFLHQNFPGQFKHLAPALSKNKKYDIHTLSLDIPPNSSKKNLEKHLKNITHHKYSINSINAKNVNRLAIEFETKMIRADAVLTKTLEMKKNGFEPDLLIIHPGWGEGFLLNEVWPKAKILNYFEFFYNTKESDVDFDLREANRPDYDIVLRTKLVARNAPFLSACNQSDIMIAPTNFQKNTAPPEYRKKIKVIHDGIDTSALKSNPKAILELTKKNNKNNTEEKLSLTKKDKVIAFVNRNLEPYRGYHIFMRSLPEIIEKHPDAYILIVGGDSVSYGSKPEQGSYKDLYFNEIKNKIPKDNKIFFLGFVEYKVLLTIFDIASVHIYYTYPFVLSWSMLESMSLGGLVVGSKTPPVEEVIKHNKNGILLDFFDTKSLSLTVNKILDNPKSFEKFRIEARKTIIENYDLYKKCLPSQIEVIEELLNEK